MNTMNFEEETFSDDEYEDDEDLEDTFPDADDDEVEDPTEERSYSIEPDVDRWVKFNEDPWPKTVFILILIGLALTTFTPAAIWSYWHYNIIFTYGLIVLTAVSSVTSIKVWVVAAGSRLKYGGATNLALVIACAILGTIDTFSWMLVATGLLPICTEPIIGVCLIVVVFSLYGLWLIQRTFVPEQ